jgi:hypothetical protein
MVFRSMRFAPLALGLGCAAFETRLEPTLDTTRVIGEGDGTVIGSPDVEVRARAAEAFRGARPGFVARFAFTTVEGDSIFYALTVGAGAATLVIDETRDGGGIRTLTFGSLDLVRYVPSVWVNNTEVAKERYEAIEPSVARTTNARVLLRGRSCSDCEYVF